MIIHFIIVLWFKVLFPIWSLPNSKLRLDLFTKKNRFNIFIIILLGTTQLQYIFCNLVQPTDTITISIYIYTHSHYSYQQSWAFFLKKKKKKTNGLISGIDVKAQKNIVPVTNITWTGLGFDIYKKLLSRLTQKLMPTHKAE